ncbi:NmrA family transcriptional regulator [Spirosoma montaniterrae]|uniref:NmrA family transcriptional regulator n=2 Tax=Spirosoma montaniterrae TaxID=1178516 RepID=A0A1P9WW06_9BACT|nr:NmrA family transcriptional regulator [Spirosoma montaniterrae]
MIGQPVTNQLIWAGYEVRIIARDVAKTKQLFPQVEVVFGDLRKPESLHTALSGVDTVYLNLSVRQTEKPGDFHTETDGMRHLLAAGKQAGVRRVAYLSSLVMRYQGINGFNWWVFRVKQQAVELIKASGLDYSIFYPSCFMDSINQTQRVGRFVLLLGQSPVKPWYISAHDYGSQVVSALQIVRQDQNQEYVIQGPEAITQTEAAERFARVHTNEKLRVVTIPPILLKAGSPFSAQASYGWHIGEALNKYPEVFEAEKTWAELGKPKLTIDEWTRFTF